MTGAILDSLSDFEVVALVVGIVAFGWWIATAGLSAIRPRHVDEREFKESPHVDPAMPRQQHPRPIGRIVARGPARLSARPAAGRDEAASNAPDQLTRLPERATNGARRFEDDEAEYGESTTLIFPPRAS